VRGPPVGVETFGGQHWAVMFPKDMGGSAPLLRAWLHQREPGAFSMCAIAGWVGPDSRGADLHTARKYRSGRSSFWRLAAVAGLGIGRGLGAAARARSVACAALRQTAALTWGQTAHIKANIHSDSVVEQT
jgi:hypothetical protein